MTDEIRIKLRALRDIEGVLGSFLVGDRGLVFGRDVTSACTTDVLSTVGSRLQQLCDAFVSAHIGGAFESTTLYFAQYKLHIRALGSLFLIAIATADVNVPALKMAMNLVGRQLLNELGSPTASERPSRPSEVHPRASLPSRMSEAPLPPARVANRTSAPPPLPSHAPGHVSELPLTAERTSRPRTDAEPLAERTSQPPEPPPRSYRGRPVSA